MGFFQDRNSELGAIIEMLGRMGLTEATAPSEIAKLVLKTGPLNPEEKKMIMDKVFPPTKSTKSALPNPKASEKKKPELGNPMNLSFLTGVPFEFKLYRGTRSSGGPADPGDLGVGQYFTTYQALARAYGTAHAYTVKLNNPKVVTSQEAINLTKEYGTIHGSWEERIAGAQNLSRDLKKAGHDGLVVKGWDGPGFTVLVFPDFIQENVKPFLKTSEKEIKKKMGG